MDKLVIINPTVSIDGNDLSAAVSKVVIKGQIEMQEATTAGDLGVKTEEFGLEDNMLEISFRHTADSSLLEGILWPLKGSKVAFSVSKAAANPGTLANPSYTGTVAVSGFDIGGQVGQQSTADVSWRIVTPITRTAV